MGLLDLVDGEVAVPRIDKNALDALRRDPDIRKRLERVAFDILDESNLNMATMDAVDTGAMRNSGTVDTSDADVIRIGYHVEYAPIVHEGTGIGKNAAPRPFLAQAAARNRGKI